MKINKLAPQKGKAQAMVEFAIALPLLLLLLYGLIEAGRLLFMYSTVVTASRQAVRYGSATGEDAGVLRYQDCTGIENAAQRFGYLGPFESVEIHYDSGPGTPSDGACPGVTITENSKRIVVTVTKTFMPIVPKLVPFAVRQISATSARTILYSVPIVVEQPPVIVVQNPTTTEITADNPDPSELNQSVTVSVTVEDTVDPSNTPTGIVDVSSTNTSCQITLVNGSGSCTLVFTVMAFNPPATIIATYSGDDQHISSTDSELHTVSRAPTITTLSLAPSPSGKNQDVIVTVTVTGGSTTPSGTVDIDAGGNDNCTITLSSNGFGTCTLNFNNTGTKTVVAMYSGDSTHATSDDTKQHVVLSGTATPSNTPTITPIPPPSLTPTITPVPTITPTGTLTPTAVPTCSGVTHGPLMKSGDTLSMTLTNPYSYPLTTGTGSVTWNHDRGHQSGSDKSLKLLTATLNGTIIWDSGPTGDLVYSVPFDTPAIIPAAVNGIPTTVTIVFNFHQSYDNFDTSEIITIQLTTEGCNNLLIDSRY